MATRRSMTRDIHESIRLILGKNAKILLKVPVKLELKGDKTENRILVFTAYRLFIMTARVPAKVDNQFHYLDFRRVDSKRPNHIAFTFSDNKTYSFRPNLDQQTSGGKTVSGSPDPGRESALIDEAVTILVGAVRRIYPGVPVEHVIGPVEISGNASRDALKEVVKWKPPDPKDLGPCGGFSSQYAAVCDYYQLTFREEVAWDVDTIYFSHDSHEMCLQDFDHLDHRDIVCIVSALEHNTWFNKLRASGNCSKLSGDICDRIVGVAGKSVSLQEVHLPSIGVRWEFAAKLAQAMSSNPHCAINSLDLSCNFIEDRGINPLSSALAKLPKGIHHMNLSYCTLTGKGVYNLMQSLVVNRSTATTLTYLNLQGNCLKEEASVQALCSFLAQPNVVAILDVSSTDTPIDNIFPALVSGCTMSLTHLNLARNPFSSSKKVKEVPAAFKKFFAATKVLTYVNVSHCKLPPDALKDLLLGLAANEFTKNVELNLSNNQLGAQGAVVLENCLEGVRCVTRLDLSENSIDAEMAGVMAGVARNRSVLSLNVSRNMHGTKAKNMAAVMDSIVHMIQDEDTTVQKLNLSDCKLKHDINNVINALGSNQCLQHLDISGNGMGDGGARLLAKALQINTRLKTINLDRNGISLQGYTDITYALNSNYAMRHIPFPTFDIKPFIDKHPDRVDGVMHRMQELLQRNSNPHKFGRNAAQAFRMTQGFVMSSTQQVLDRHAASAQDAIDAVKKVRPDMDEDEVRPVKDFIREADNSKHLLSALHDTAAKRALEVEEKLKAVSTDLTVFLTEHVKNNLNDMLECASSQCPRVMGRREGRVGHEVRAGCQSKCQIPPSFVSALINDHVGLEVHNKINELNLIIANQLSERVIEDVVEAISEGSKSLTSEIALKKKRSLTPDVLKSGGGSSASASPLTGTTASARSTSMSESLEVNSQGGPETMSMMSGTGGGSGCDLTSQKSEPSPLSTPQTNKRVMTARKLRPKSVIDGGDGHAVNKTATPDLLEASASTNRSRTPTELSHSHLNGGGRSTTPNFELETVPEMGGVIPGSARSSTPLTHLGKSRPKRPKSRAPSRGAVVAASPAATDESLASSFFHSPIMSPSSRSALGVGVTRSASATPEHTSSTPSSMSTAHQISTSAKNALSQVLKSPRSRNASREDMSSERLSPLLPPSTRPRTTSTGHQAKPSGLSCLTSAAADEESPPPPPPPHGRPSPEKKSGGSVSDIFAKSASSKLSKSKAETVAERAASPPVISKKAEASSIVSDNIGSPACSPDPGGKKTPEGVIKRHGGLGHGGNADLMAEMREKRASMAMHPKAQDEELSPRSELPKEKPAFGNVKLRSTGLAGTLTSPTATEPFAPTTLQASPSTSAVKSSTLATAASTTAASLAASSSFHLAKAVGPESPEPLDASEDCPKGSIVGLRASKWGTSSSSLTPSTGISPEVKPRTVLSALPTVPSIGSLSASSNSKETAAAIGTSSTSLAQQQPSGPRPKPLPKPRPVGLLNLDQVKDNPKDSTSPKGSSAVAGGGGGGGAGHPSSAGVASNRVGAVRDMFNNMNRTGAGNTSAENSPVSSSHVTSNSGPVEFRRKGNSLPRGTAPVPSTASSSGAVRKPSSESPGVSKKDSSADDDPRILKLDDEFDVDEEA